MATVVLPASLLHRSSGVRRVEAEGSTVRETLVALEDVHPSLRGWILDERRGLRRHVNVFVGSRRVDLDHAVSGADEIFVIQAISGG